MLYWITARYHKKLLAKFADTKRSSILFPFKSRAKNVFKFSLVLIAVVFLILGLANPQIGSKVEEVKQVGIDVFILLDVSNSMNAEDIKPNRLEKAKYEISELIKKLWGDRLGLIVFAGESYVQIPLTTDYSAANLFLSAVDNSSVPQQGTNISDAIQLAMNSFKEDAETDKAIVVITDGEDHRGNLEEVAKEAVDKEIKLYSIGLGSPSGSPIPVLDKAGNQIGFKKDRRGNTVISKLDEETLQKIARLGNGNYYRGFQNDNELGKIYKDLSTLKQSEFGATKITEYEDRFYYFLIPAIIILFVEFFISGKKSKFFMKFDQKIDERLI